MAYYDVKEHRQRIDKVKEILEANNLDFAFIYYDEFNLANGWYLTAWCPQFESGAVLVPRDGEPMILGGPESEPFAKQDSAIKETRNLPVFMVPDEEYPNATIISFSELFEEISSGKKISRVGMVGASQMPVSVYNQVADNFKGVELVDITEEYLKLRYIKSKWEIEQIREAFRITDAAYKAMVEKIKPGVREYEVAAAGEAAARAMGANGFAYKTIVGSGKRSNAVVPTAMDKVMEDGEMVMLGISPRWKGYSGVFGDTLPVGGEFTPAQKECMKHMREVLYLTREQLKPGKIGKEVDAPGRAYFEKIGYLKYLVCPFAHTIGIMEAEAPFFGPNSTDVIEPGMTICVDVSFFGHPEFNGIRIETGYEITEKGVVPLSEEMDRILLGER
ncbi:MAG TPA: aminopeptidase P family protein [Clostridiaceae bacterium]|nr:aminopeptidase P family protein [Clostridiaceae bacterium]